MAYNDTPLADEDQDVSQPLIRQNFQQANTSFGIDHYNFADLTVNNGRHKNIHQVPENPNVDPAAIAGINQVYSKLYTPNYVGAVADTQLFTRTGNGGISQLTGNNAIQNGGWTWIGGMLLMWGQQALPGIAVASGTVTFSAVSATSIPFPTSCFNVQLTFKSNAVTNSNAIVVTGTPTNLAFSWAFSGSATIQSFYWFAIGR